MVKDRYDEIKKWPEEYFDKEDATKNLLEDFLCAEIMRFKIFLEEKGIPVKESIIDAYAQKRGFIQ